MEQFTRTIQINLVGTFMCDRAAAVIMQHNAPGPDGERGVLIHTSSVAAFEGQIGQVAYTATKAAVAAMTLPIARELAMFGIRCVAIAPGIFHTPMLAGICRPTCRSHWASRFPSRHAWANLRNSQLWPPASSPTRCSMARPSVWMVRFACNPSKPATITA